MPAAPATDPSDDASPPAALEPRLARLEVHFEHFASELRELRIDVRTLTQKVDADVGRLTQKGDQDFRTLLERGDENFRTLLERGDENFRTLLERGDENVRTLSKRIDQHFYFNLGAFAGLAGLLAKGFHWI